MNLGRSIRPLPRESSPREVVSARRGTSRAHSASSFQHSASFSPKREKEREKGKFLLISRLCSRNPREYQTSSCSHATNIERYDLARSFSLHLYPFRPAAPLSLSLSLSLSRSLILGSFIIRRLETRLRTSL